MAFVSVSRRGDLRRSVVDASRRARDLPGVIAGEVADPAADAVLDAVKAQRGSLSLSGLNARLDVLPSVRSGRASATVELDASPRSAWGVASGTKPHAIKPRRKAVKLAGGRFFPEVKHPGTKKVDLWGRSTRAAGRRITTVFRDSARANNPFRGGR